MSYRHVSHAERYVIYHLRLCGLSRREIGRRLGRHHSTIARELARNGPRAGAAVYWHEVAQRRAEARRCRQARCRGREHRRLHRYVVSRLRRDWSPEPVAGRLRRDYPGQVRIRVSAETIYQWVYRDAQAGGDLFGHLRRRHRRRRKQDRYGRGRGRVNAGVRMHHG